MKPSIPRVPLATTKSVAQLQRKEEPKSQTPPIDTGKDYSPPPRYILAKKYSPKTDRNTATWNKITAALADGPKTLAELTKAVEDHKDFVGYMVRGGHLVIAQQAAN